MLIEYKTDCRKDETYVDWVARKRLDGFSLTIASLSDILQVSRTWIYMKLRRDCPYIKVRSGVYYRVDSVDKWLMEHSSFTVQTRVLNILDYCTFEDLKLAERQSAQKTHTYYYETFSGRIKGRNMVGYMPEKLLKCLSLPLYSVPYYNRPSCKETPVKPFKYLLKQKVFPKYAGKNLEDVSHKFFEQFYREAFMRGYCKVMICGTKTVWIPLRIPQEFFIQWTVPAMVTTVNEVVIEPLEDVDFSDDMDLKKAYMKKKEAKA